MTAPQRPLAIILFWRFHRWIYKISDGRIGSRMLGHKILSLTTTGRHSGEKRTILIYFFPYQESYVIVASNLGADQHPAWYLNLQEDPSAEIQVGRERIDIEARTAVGEERETLWGDIVKKDKSYEEYKNKTERQFPLVVLDPIDKTAQ